jgi:hypothetical protein
MECLSRGRVVRESALTLIRTDIYGGATVQRVQYSGLSRISMQYSNIFIYLIIHPRKY